MNQKAIPALPTGQTGGRQGFAPIIVLLIAVGILAIGGGALFYIHRNKFNIANPPPPTTSPATPAASQRPGASTGETPAPSTAGVSPNLTPHTSPVIPQTCSPKGTPTCDMNGRSIVQSGISQNAVPLAPSSVPFGSTLPANSNSAQTCSPPGTPTCDPSGHVITGQGQSQNLQNVPSFSDSVVGNITLTGHAPQGLDVDPATGYVYTGNNGNIVAKCAGNNPNSTEKNITFTPQMQPGDNTMSIVDPSRMKELALINTDFSPIWPTVDGAKGVVYVAASPAVDAFKLTTGEKITSYNVGGSPHQAAVDDTTGVLVVSNTYDGSENYYSAVNTNTGQVIGHYRGIGMPHGVALDSAKDLAYMIAVRDGTIGVIDMTSGKLKTTYTTDNGNTNFRGTNILTFSPRERKIYFVESDQTNGFEGVEILNADNGKLVGKIQLPTIPWGIALDDINHLLYAALPDLDSIGIASTETFKEVASIPVSACPFAVKIDPARELGFSTGMVNSQLSVFDVSKVISDLKKLNLPGR